jgi:arylformamidase
MPAAVVQPELRALLVGGPRGAAAPQRFFCPEADMARLYDITLPIREDMITYPGNPPTRVRPHSSIADGDDANVTELSFGSHTGTHVDAAHHFIDGGQTVDELPLDTLIGDALVVELPDSVTAIGEQELKAAGVRDVARVLLKTRNGVLLEKDEFDEGFAHITGDGAEYLVQQGVRLVAIDYLSVEAFAADEPRAHQTLLAKEIIVVEGVDLREVPPGRYELICLPLKVSDIDGAPLRAVLRETG